MKTLSIVVLVVVFIASCGNPNRILTWTPTAEQWEQMTEFEREQWAAMEIAARQAKKRHKQQMMLQTYYHYYPPQ